VGAVARLSPEKGLDVLLRASAKLRERGIDVCVLLVGDGPIRDELMRLAAELKVEDSVEFTGAIAHEEVPTVLQRMDIFAIPSTWEGFGVAALEASAMELPVVGSRIHGLPDVVVEGETGLLVPPADPVLLADAIAKLAHDPPLRQRMGQAGRAFVLREYRWQDNARLMEVLYHEMLDSGVSARS
jgi:glycosyltransferase involved in cell wall biosynthesis